MKRVLSLMLVVLLLCGTLGATAVAENTVTIKIPVYDRGHEGWNVTDNYYTRWIQSEFGDPNGINVEYVAIARNNEVQDFYQMLAAQTAPDIIFHYDMPKQVNYWNDGAMQALDLEEMKIYAPTFYERTIASTQQYGYMEGEPYFFFAERPNTGYNHMVMIRKDWCDQVGMELPTSTEEMTAVLEAWKEAGLGVYNEWTHKNYYFETYPYWQKEGTEISDLDHAIYMDISLPDLTTAAHKAWLKDLNERYNKGLLDTEFYLDSDTAETLDNFLDGSAGTYEFYLSSGDTVLSSLKANFPDAEVACLDPAALSPEGYVPYGRAEYPFGMIMGINATTTEEERIAVWKFLEWMLQEDHLFILQNGLEGADYEIDAQGLPVTTENNESESRRSKNNNKDYWCLWTEAISFGSEELDYAYNLKNYAPEGYEYLIEDSKKYFDAYAQYKKTEALWISSVESQVEYSTDLVNLYQELSVEIIISPVEEFEGLYEKACQEYLDAGYQEILDEKTEMFEAGMCR